jgi:hypothetical protein
LNSTINHFCKRSIDFLAQAKPLLKNDALDGEYIIKVRVVEAEFADGTIWREQDA